MPKLISYSVDLDDIFAEFMLSKPQASQMTKLVLDRVTQAFARQWQEEAKKTLHSTRNDYVQSIVVIERGRLTNAVVLMGKLNNMIEQGVSAFDMKEGFKKSLKAKQSKKGGWYLTIPFRVGAPTSLGESESFSGILPEEIHEIAKNKPTSIITGKSKGISLEEVPDKFKERMVREEIPQSSLSEEQMKAYKHKSPLHEGTFKVEKTYEKTTQSQYLRMRRVSNNSEPNSWIHSGFKAYNLAEKAFNNTKFDIITDNTVDEFLANL